ncbi:MAG: NAD(P)H-hydrate dehydratase [Planctomycetes bacterium]|nr:NAD(P)H-hydrate dehydratase [Planctomycetota bacterium]
MRRIRTLPPLPKRKADSHKGTYGRVLILAGSVGMTGAACLAARAALRGGAGLVTLGIPKSLNAIVASKLTCVMTRPLPETSEQSLSLKAGQEIAEMSRNAQVVALGPGLSQNPGTKRLVLWLLKNLDGHLVLDADGLNAVAGEPGALNGVKAQVILTPHPGEMDRLMGFDRTDSSRTSSRRLKAVTEFAKEYPHDTLVLKGHKSLVVHKDMLYENTTGNPGMASAGTGDVLTGLIAGLWAQGWASAFEASALGVYLHGLAGDLARDVTGEYSLTATDVLDALPGAFIAYGKKGRK